MRIRRTIIHGLLTGLILSGFVLVPNAGAETDAPTIGCNKQGCSLYVFAYAWPDVVEFNALDFFRFKFDVDKDKLALSGSVKYAGILCMIPKLAATKICPQANPEPEDAPALDPIEGTESAPEDTWTSASVTALAFDATTPDI